MLFLRSLVFNVLFYVTTLIQMVIFAPYYFWMPRLKAWAIPNNWSRFNMWMLRVICGIKFEVEGLENMPKTACIIAPKHLSALDTFCFLPYFNDVLLILKRILMSIPIFGWYVARMRMIAIDRGNREDAIRKVNEGAKRAMEGDRQLLIYPEGTRRPVGAEPAYKSGIAHLYKALNVPVVPIAHVSGLFWPKNSFLRYPGTFKARFLEPIEPGLSREAFMKELIARTEAGCDALLLETAAMDDCPPLSETAQKRLDTLKAQSIS